MNRYTCDRCGEDLGVMQNRYSLRIQFESGVLGYESAGALVGQFDLCEPCVLWLSEIVEAGFREAKQVSA